ncbi:MAG: FxLYD domain-containing protein [Candidatus Thiodiazotropha taylori]|nr:FxLYD domain-containing protein [Candidatus Thiodiazotropha taylori]
MSVIKKIVSGFLYGIGFGVSAGLIFFFISEKMSESVWNEEIYEKLIIVNHTKSSREGNVVVLGAVLNNGKESARFIQIKVDLFDESGAFVEQCSETLSGSLKPGKSRNFKVSCGGCKSSPVVEHKSYKVYIVGM